MEDETRMTIRLPGPVAAWLRDTKDREGSTTNFEIIRSIRERMERHHPETKTAPESGATLPKASPGA